jgi:hypothetical protein
MKLTPKALENIYIMLCSIKPFSGWSMPTSAEVMFVVTNELDALGTYVFDDDKDIHVITISKAKNGHLDTVIKTLAHEMIHLKRHKTKHWDKHDAVFRKYAHSVATELGFDPLEL